MECVLVTTVENPDKTGLRFTGDQLAHVASLIYRHAVKTKAEFKVTQSKDSIYQLFLDAILLDKSKLFIFEDIELDLFAVMNDALSTWDYQTEATITIMEIKNKAVVKLNTLSIHDKQPCYTNIFPMVKDELALYIKTLED